MREFEYRILKIGDFTEAALNELGEKGWELVCSAQSIVYGSCLILKREVPEPQGEAAEKRK